MGENASPALRRHGVFMVTPDLIGQLLCLPVGHAIIGARWDDFGQSIVFQVDGPDIPVSAISAPGPARLNLVIGKRADGRLVSHFEARTMRGG